ncbi:hypothetical protein AMJ40_01785 [candidate division TA06 bacterium DG_26]|uniref:3-isopropylmalate dehydratase large subunit n=1 Tax=candidate division TA06 bacterium DG_26 TaxID=1703771 RepID=A0A0S7WKW5_UNCT6|nr:MAG: hypothetical protein AMJ40_01785 [candidate division TA06 bacterium DG_26]
MGKTIVEKILSKASGSDVHPDERIWAHVDLVTMRDFGGPNVVLEYRNSFGQRPLYDHESVAITFDLHVPPRDDRVAANQKMLREFAEQEGVTLFDVHSGVGQHVLFEHGFVKPWEVVIGTDSHMNLLGAFGCFATGVGTTDIVGALATGKLWFRVPHTYRYMVDGTLPHMVSAKDVILRILKEVGTDGAAYKAVEFAGAVVDRMNLSERITLTSMVTEMSGKIGFVPPNKSVVGFLSQRVKSEVQSIWADEDAQYERVLSFDATELQPQIACPDSPDNVMDVRSVAGTKIDQAFIGSCTNGRYEDLKAAADILNGRHVKPGVRLIVVPATMEVASQAVREGLYDIFLEAGAVVPNPSCALCTYGHPGILASGEVMVSTSNRNFIGKLGKGGKVYLASPATAAASAVRGVITDPRDI